jgi:predicted DNA-binding transcriptional regulator AlpA
MSDAFTDVRVLSRAETIKAVGVSQRTWQRLEACGDTPCKTQLSANRIGYRILDIQRWLDSRRRVAQPA